MPPRTNRWHTRGTRVPGNAHLSAMDARRPVILLPTGTRRGHDDASQTARRVIPHAVVAPWRDACEGSPRGSGHMCDLATLPALPR